MSNEEDNRFETAFGELGRAAELMVEPVDATAIHGQLRRRRATRGALAAGACALLVAGPAGWWLQVSDGAELDPLPAGEQTTEIAVEQQTPTEPAPETTAEEQSRDVGGEEEAAPPPAFDDLVGGEMDLPSFNPGDDLMDQACPVDNAELVDGSTGRPFATGQVNLLEVVTTPLREGGPERAVMFLGCRFAEASAFQAVALTQRDDGGWTAGEQLITSKSNADSPYDIAPAADYGLLVGVAERFVCCDMDPDELDYWVERIRIDAETGAIDQQRLEEDDVDSGVFTNLTVMVEWEPTDEADVYEVKLTVENEGPEESGYYMISACAYLDEIEFDVAVHDCDEGRLWVEKVDPLSVGETHTTTWIATVAADADRSEGIHTWFAIEPVTFEASGIVRDGTFADNKATMQIF